MADERGEVQGANGTQAQSQKGDPGAKGGASEISWKLSWIQGVKDRGQAN